MNNIVIQDAGSDLCKARSGPSFEAVNNEIVMRLAQNTLTCLRQVKTRELKFFHGLLMDHLKFASPEMKGSRKLSPEEAQERMWDVFGIPEEERVKRRMSFSKEM